MLKTIVKGCEPTKGSKYSACIDLYASEDVVIGAGETVLVGLGVEIDLDYIADNTKTYKWAIRNGTADQKTLDSIKKSELDSFMKSHYLQLEPRSSLRAKGIQSGTGIIDIDFISHCKIDKINNNGKCPYFKRKAKE